MRKGKKVSDGDSATNVQHNLKTVTIEYIQFRQCVAGYRGMKN